MRLRNRIYIVLIIVIVALQVINVKGFDGNSQIIEDKEYKFGMLEWDSIIADSVNSKDIVLKIDGKEIGTNQCKTYMNSNRELMISTTDFTRLFQCSYRFYSGNTVIIEKGETRIKAVVDSYSVEINDKVIVLKSKIEKVGEEVYLPITLIQNGLGYVWEFDIENNIVQLINSKSDEAILPTKYDYRTDGRLSSIKDQGQHSTCWAFASLAALESSILPIKIRDYSEKNMTLNSGYAVSLMSGGDYTMAMSYLAAWRGPILEKYEEGYGKYETPTNVLPDVHVQEIQLIKGKNQEAIKKAIFFYGGVQSSIYMAINSNNLSSKYYNKDTSAYCYIGTNRPNHDIVIIGWDDNYSKENFNFEPDGDGAYICQNSWGEGFGEEGIFYVSYYDSNIGMNNVVYTGVEESDNYDNIYQSDICGFVGQLGYESPEAYFANVYKAEADELLEAVSFYATDKNTEYEVFLVEDFKDKTSFEKKRYLQKGSFSNAGYYTVKLDESVPIEKGKKYAVIIKIKTPNSVHPIAIEYKANYETSTVNINDGEGYISYVGKEWERVEDTKSCNICLKMFTSDVK